MLFSFFGQKESLCPACQGFFKKYKLSEAKSGDFLKNPQGLTFTSRKRHSDTFARKKGEQPSKKGTSCPSFRKKSFEITIEKTVY